MGKYVKHLADRFIKDYSLPISNINEKNFEFQLDFFQDKFESRTKWEFMHDIIDEQFDGNHEAFLSACSNDIDTAVDKIKNSEGFKRFNEDKEFCDFKQITGIPTKFTPETGKTYVSVDLVKANFQALNTYDSSIFDNKGDYLAWLSTFASSEYTKRSKYFRQVVFGMCNPSRQITREKSMVYHINEVITSTYEPHLKLVSANSDELIYEVIKEFKDMRNADISYNVKSKTGYSVRSRMFYVTKYHLETKSGHKRNGFYVKNYLTGEDEAKCLEKQYTMIAECLMNGMDNNSIPKECFHFNADGLDAIINEKFILVEDK